MKLIISALVIQSVFCHIFSSGFSYAQDKERWEPLSQEQQELLEYQRLVERREEEHIRETLAEQRDALWDKARRLTEEPPPKQGRPVASPPRELNAENRGNQNFVLKSPSPPQPIWGPVDRNSPPGERLVNPNIRVLDAVRISPYLEKRETLFAPLNPAQNCPTESPVGNRYQEKVAGLNAQLSLMRAKYKEEETCRFDSNCPVMDCRVPELVALLESPRREAFGPNQYYRAGTVFRLNSSELVSIPCDFHLVPDSKGDLRLTINPFRTPIAKGGFKKMMIGMEYDTLKWKAQLKVDPADKMQLDSVIHEVGISKILQGQGLAKPYQLIETGKRSEANSSLPEIVLTQDYYNRGSLKKFLEQRGADSCAPLRMSVELLQAIATIHEKGYIHSDIKPDNVFVYSDRSGDHAALGDHGFSAPANSLFVGGTRNYLPPESHRPGARSTPAADVWQLGLTLFELLANQPPTTNLLRRARSPANVPAVVSSLLSMQDVNSTFGTQCGYPRAPWEDTICSMLNPNPAFRITARDALNRLHPLGIRGNCGNLNTAVKYGPAVQAY